MGLFCFCVEVRPVRRATRIKQTRTTATAAIAGGRNRSRETAGGTHRQIVWCGVCLMWCFCCINSTQQQINGAVAFAHQALEGKVRQAEPGGGNAFGVHAPGWLALHCPQCGRGGRGALINAADGMCIWCAWDVACGVHGMWCSMMYACNVM